MRILLDGLFKTGIEYRVVGNIKEKVMANFLSWIRFIVYDGDPDAFLVIVSK